MNWKKSFLDEKELLIASLCIAIAIVFLFVPMKGSDNFYLLGAVCQKDPGITSHFGFLTGFFLQHFSCSETAYKAIGGLLLFWTTIVLMKIGKLFTPRGWMAGLLIFLAPSWIMSFFLWEDNQIGLLFGLVFVYFFLQYQETKKMTTILTALFFLGIGIGFWNGTALFLPAFAIFSPILIVLTGLLGLVSWQNIGALLPVFGVDEAAFGIGWIAWPAFLIVGYHSIPKKLFFLFFSFQ